VKGDEKEERLLRLKVKKVSGKTEIQVAERTLQFNKKVSLSCPDSLIFS